MQRHSKGVSVIDTKNMTIHYMLNTFKWGIGIISVEISENNIDSIIIHGCIEFKEDNYHYTMITINLKEDESSESSETREGKLE